MIRWCKSTSLSSWIGYVTPLRLGVLFCSAVVIVAAGLRFPAALGELDAKADANAAANYDDLIIGGGNSVIPTGQVVFEIDARIPEMATYRIVVGEEQEGWEPLTRQGAEGFLRYWLLPRLPTRHAEWIICVGCNVALDAPGATETWTGPDGFRLLRSPR